MKASWKAAREWHMHRDLFFCVFLVTVATVIASQGSGRPAHRVIFLELNLSAAAVAGFLANFIASLFYVAYRQDRSDAWALAGARVGVMLFGLLFIVALFRFHSYFAVWWVWDRALSWAVLVVPAYVSYLLLRRYANPGQVPTLGAVLGVFAFLDLPLAYFSVALRSARTTANRQIEGACLPMGSIVLLVALAAAATWFMSRWEIIRRREADGDPTIAV